MAGIRCMTSVGGSMEWDGVVKEKEGEGERGRMTEGDVRQAF